MIRPVRSGSARPDGKVPGMIHVYDHVKRARIPMTGAHCSGRTTARAVSVALAGTWVVLSVQWYLITSQVPGISHRFNPPLLRRIWASFISASTVVARSSSPSITMPPCLSMSSGNARLDGKVVHLQREFRSISTTKCTNRETGTITYSYKKGKVRSTVDRGMQPYTESTFARCTAEYDVLR